MAITRRRRQPWDETLPNGQPAIMIGGPRQMGGRGDALAAVQSPSEAILPRPRTLSLVPDLLPEDQDLLAPQGNIPVNVGQAPLTDTIKRRPHRMAGLELSPSDQQMQQEQYRDRLEDYKPQSESKKMTALRMAQAVLTGGPFNALSPLMNRKRSDQAWQQNEIQGADEAINRIGDRRRQGMQDRILSARVNEIENPSPDKQDLEWIPQDDQTDRLLPRRQGMERRVRTKPVTVTPRNPMQRERKNADGSTSFEYSDDQGKTWRSEPGDAAPPAKPDETPAAVATRQRNYRAAKTKFEGLITQEREAERKKNQFYGQASVLKAKFEAMPIPKGKDDVKAITDRENAAAAWQDAEKKAEAAEAKFQSFGPLKSAAEAEMLQHEDGPQAQSSGYSRFKGRRISRAKLPEAAKREGKTVEQIEKELVASGAVVY